MAKKKAAKKPARKAAQPAKKASRKRAAPAKRSSARVKIPTASRRVTRSRKPSKSAGTIEVVKPPMIDVTPEIKKDVVIIKPEKKPVVEERAPAVAHEAFAKSLTQAPPKKGFFARLFGRE
jgi:hypothetical protein